MKLKIATLNIQGGYKIGQLAKEVKNKLAPLDLLCLQEVCAGPDIPNHAEQIAKILGKDYQAAFFLPIDFGIKRMGNGFVFRKSTLRLVKVINLPLASFVDRNRTGRFFEKGFLSCRRLAHIGTFANKSGSFQTANVHLDFFGGSKVRQKQVEEVLAKFDPGLPAIITGDFNTIGIIRRQFYELNWLRKQGFAEVSQKIRWTASPAHPDPNWKITYPFFKLIRPLHARLHQKNDYIFTKRFSKKSSCRAIGITASDHHAVVCRVSVKPKIASIKLPQKLK